MRPNPLSVQTTWHVASLALLIAASACGSDETDAALNDTAPTQRDSASITIIENRLPSWGDGTPWLVDSAPLMAPTYASSAVEFQHLLSVHRLADGSVVALDMTPPFVHALAPDGSLLWSAINRGEGPGEIRAPALITRIRGDTLVLEDADTPRSLLLAGDGTVLGLLPSRLIRLSDGDGERMLQPAVRLADGSLVGYTPIMRRVELAGDGIVSPRWPAYLMSRDGEQVTALGEWRFITTAQLAAPSVHVVFGSTAALAPTPDGFL